jgi:hypothetical protein
MDTLKIQKVKAYAQLRKEGKVTELLKFFTSNAEVIDVESQTHKGETQLRTYYEQPSPDITSVKDPILLPNGQVMLEFTVKKYLMNWPIKAFFTFATDMQIERIVLQR